jgi:SWI/SNF-related matrix-associated actin-dependent regulator of chromatin subfamily A3
MLTRMRQLALHTGLIPSNYLEQLRETDENDNAPAVQLSAQDKLRLQDQLLQAIEDSEECPICFSVLSDPRITSCAHAFCFAWSVFPMLIEVLESENSAR